MSRLVGDRCVIILVTASPWRWRRYLTAWRRLGVEWVVCSEVSGSGGLITVAGDHVGFNDLLAIVTDLDGMEIIAKYNYDNPELPECPVVEVLQARINGSFEAYSERSGTIRSAWKALGWPEVRSLIEPKPDQLASWCIGWWAGRKGVE